MVDVDLYIEVDAEIMMDGGGECIDHSVVKMNLKLKLSYG